MVICTTLYFPGLIQRSDFLSSFYVAGRMAATGLVQNLYPDSTQTTLMMTQFNSYAHQILPSYPSKLNAAYMYPPLMAFLFEPISLLPPPTAFLFWQVLSIFAFGLCALIFSSLNGGRWSSYFWGGLLFFPVFQTIYIGHIGIIAGLLPLSLGYWCLMRGHPIMAGIVWSLLLLKLQFLPVVLLVIGALCLTGQLTCVIAFALGGLVLAISNIVCFGPDVAYQWLVSLRLSDAIFSDPRYTYPTYLVSSLPGAVVQLVPFLWREAVKKVFYLLAVFISMQALWVSWQLVKKVGQNCLSQVSLIFVLGAFLLPLISPHLLFYDLSILALAGMIIYGQPIFKSEPHLVRDLLLAWFFVDAYFTAIMFTKSQLAQPAILVIVLGWLYMRILKILQTQIANSSEGF